MKAEVRYSVGVDPNKDGVVVIFEELVYHGSLSNGRRVVATFAVAVDGNMFDRAMAEGDTVEPTENAKDLIANLKHINERRQPK